MSEDVRRAQETPNLVREVVVGADGSTASHAGLMLARDIGRRTGANIHVVFVRHVPSLAALSREVDGGAAAAEAVDAVEAQVRAEAAQVLDPAGVGWSYAVREGSPGAELVSAVKELGADLIVVGSKPRGSVHNLVTGSTAEWLVAHSPARVLVAR